METATQMLGKFDHKKLFPFTSSFPPYCSKFSTLAYPMSVDELLKKHLFYITSIFQHNLPCKCT